LYKINNTDSSAGYIVILMSLAFTGIVLHKQIKSFIFSLATTVQSSLLKAATFSFTEYKEVLRRC